MRFLCRFGIHKWPMWLFLPNEVGMQARQCQRCGLAQRNKIHTKDKW